MKNIVLRLLFFFLSALGLAQEQYVFQQLSAEEGVSQSIVYALAQDSIGNIWMATEEGVIRYNSKSSKNFNKYSGLPEDFNSRVKSIFIDSEDEVWIGSEDGIAFYDKSKNKFQKVNAQTRLQPSLVEFITEDDNRNIWFAAYNGVWELTKSSDSTEVKRYGDVTQVQTIHIINGEIIVGTRNGLYNLKRDTGDLKKLSQIGDDYFVTDLAILDEESLLIGTRNNGLIKVNSDFDLVEKIDLPTGVRDFPIFDLIVSDGEVYIATDGAGLIITDPDFKEFKVFQNDENSPNSISSNGIYDIHIDYEGILWIATYGGGMNFHNPNYSDFTSFRHIINEENSLASNFVRSIAQDALGRIWFGTKNGISIYNAENNIWKQIPNFSDKPLIEYSEIILALEPDGNDMWVGTYDSGAFKMNISSFKTEHYSTSKYSEFSLNKIYDIHKDKSGDIWFGGIDGKLTKLDSDNKIKTYEADQIRNISDGFGNFILVAGRNGVQKLNKETGELLDYEILTPGNNSFDYFTINSVKPFNDKFLILATNGGGLVFYNLETSELTNLNIQKGLPSDIVQGILISEEENIWASTTNGLVNIRISENDTILRMYDESDGLASTEFNYGSFARLNDGRLAFGGTNGASVFKPSQINEQSRAPRIYLEDLMISNTVIHPGKGPLINSINVTDEIKLDHDQNSFGFDFVGVLHKASSKVKYSWMLEGFNNKWTKPGNQSSVSYTNINPGEYIFKVRAANRLGEFGPVREVKINIGHAWYASPLASIFYFFFFIGLFALIIYVTSQLVNKRNAEQQVDFYNNLTHEIKTPLTILLSSLDNYSKNKADQKSNERIRGTIKRINSLFEQMLTYQKSTGTDVDEVDAIDLQKHGDEMLNDFQPLLDEKNLKIEFNNNWKEELFYFNKEDFNKIWFNLISNAIKYSYEGGGIKVTTEIASDNFLKIIVSDNGMGIPADQQKNILRNYYRARNVVNSQQPGTGLGLMLVKNIVTKTKGEIAFESKQNEGTEFYVKLKNRKSFYKQKAIVERSEEKAIHLADMGILTEFSDSKILLVEDNDELRKELERILGNYFQVFEAKNGKQGLEKSAVVFPDLIITDLIMPEMDGLAMAKAIKKDINLNHIPIFILTVLQNRGQKIESLEAGISEYLEKPIDINLLIAKIVNALKWQKKLQKKYQQESELETAVKFKNENDEKFIKEIEAFILERIKDENFSIHDVCERFNMSRTSLYMKLKNLIDLSPQDLIINTRLKYSKNLLIKTDKNIKEIAYESGFSNPKYFSTSFKKFFDISPSQFRASLKNEAG